LPHLEKIYQEFKDRGFQMFIIDALAREDMTRKVIDEAGFSGPVLLDDRNVSEEKYNLYATPTTFIIDREGRIIFRHVGFGPDMEKMMAREVEALLEPAS
jgi:peroxiredoxin